LMPCSPKSAAEPVDRLRLLYTTNEHEAASPLICLGGMNIIN
jgi:hypothetical protein